MKTYIITLFIAATFTSGVFAQSDSVSVVKADWKKEKILPGLRLKTFWFNKTLFNSNQNVSILEIKEKKNLLFDLGFETKNWSLQVISANRLMQSRPLTEHFLILPKVDLLIIYDLTV